MPKYCVQVCYHDYKEDLENAEADYEVTADDADEAAELALDAHAETVPSDEAWVEDVTLIPEA